MSPVLYNSNKLLKAIQLLFHGKSLVATLMLKEVSTSTSLVTTPMAVLLLVLTSTLLRRLTVPQKMKTDTLVTWVTFQLTQMVLPRALRLTTWSS